MSDYYLCEELIVEIFTRLPVRSLIRFRSLSKYLHSRIASLDFIRKNTALQCMNTPQKVYIRHQLSNQILGSADIYALLSDDHLSYSKTGLSGIPAVQFPFNGFSIVGSCNGIFCMIDYQKNITLWNPLIRYKLALPPNPFLINDVPFAVGFGFDEVAQDYKVLMIFYKYLGIIQSASVYDLKSSTWRVLANLPDQLFVDVISSGCFVNGALHWVAKSYLNKSDEIICHYILTFDLSTHVFGRMSLPKDDTRRSRRLTIINGCLSVINGLYDDDDIWVMKEYYNDASWSLAIKLKNLNLVVDKFTQLSTNDDLSGITSFKSLIAYNPSTGEFVRLITLIW